MADLKYYDVILKPVITENSMAVWTEKIYFPGTSRSKQNPGKTSC